MASDIRINRLLVTVPHPHNGGAEVTGDEDQVCIPVDLVRWMKRVNESLKDHCEVGVHFSSTASPGQIAIAIDHVEMEENAFNSLMDGKSLGFLLDVSTLKKLRAVIDLCIVAEEEEKVQVGKQNTHEQEGM